MTVIAPLALVVGVLSGILMARREGSNLWPIAAALIATVVAMAVVGVVDILYG